MINELTLAGTGPGHGRLVLCLAASTLVVAAVLSVFDWPPGRYDVEPVPAALDVLLARESVRPRPEPAEVPRADHSDAAEESNEEPAVEASAEDTGAEQVEAAAAASADGQSDPDRQVDWQASLERASAETVEAHSTPESLHPDFDALRRIAAVKYAPPQTGKPPPIWENVETDIYGRTLLRHGSCFRVLDDMNVGNRYAFETFERHLVFCEWQGGGRQEFPWVETIVARYAYLREPDGGLAGIEEN